MRDEETRSEVRDALLNYLDTDTVWYAWARQDRKVLTCILSFHHDDPEQLVKLQQAHWDPLIEWARNAFDIEIHIHRSVLFNSQPEQTRRVLGDVLAQMDPWEMAGMSFVTNSELVHLTFSVMKPWNGPPMSQNLSLLHWPLLSVI